jgi:phosphoribosylamine---glycine ligase
MRRAMTDHAAGMRVLLVGSGAREHALGTRLRASEHVDEVIVAPGNGGTERELRNAPLASLGDVAAIVNLAREERPDLIVIGPEAPLVAGAADALREAGFQVFGPGRLGAQLEGSKAFFKAFALRHGIPTAACEMFTDAGAAHAYIDAAGRPLVVKADGLCAGKGVVVARTAEQAHAAVDAMLVERVFGAAGAVILVEELIEGSEASVHFLTDGKGYLVLPAAQDHKRLLDGDAGPNTGGMGAYAPAPLVDEAMARRIEEQVVRPTLRGLHADGIPFRGVLFAGMMITPSGDPYVLEYNTRFGDPETEVLMAVLDEDVPALLTAVAAGRLERAGAADADGAAACVVLAAEGYPGKPRAGDEITGLDEAGHIDGVYVLHAGTTREAGRVVTSGGRVLCVTAHAPTLADAVARAYEGCARIGFDGMQLRRDIGHQALAPAAGEG